MSGAHRPVLGPSAWSLGGAPEVQARQPRAGQATEHVVVCLLLLD